MFQYQLPQRVRLQYGNAVTVRLVRTRDAQELQRLMQRQREWLKPWEATYPGSEAAQSHEIQMRSTVRALLRSFRGGTVLPLVIEVDGAVVGQVTVSEMSGGALQNAQLGYWISQDHAGRGITPIAVALTIDFLFFQLGLHRVEICVVPENSKSLRVVEKLGLRAEGLRQRYIHIDGAWRDHRCFAVTSEEVPEGMLQRLVSRENT